MSHATYSAMPGLRWSTLSAALDSALHLRHRLDTPREDTAALQNGRIVHCAVLEPERFATESIVVPSRFMTGSGKVSESKDALAWRSSLPPEAPVLTEVQREDLLRMVGALHAHPVARTWLDTATVRERPVTWTETVQTTAGEVKVDGKAMPDALSPALGLMWDLKTTTPRGRALTVRHCIQEIAARNYFAQAGWYDRGLASKGTAPEAWGWLFVESKEPFDIVCAVADADMMAAGRETAERALHLYAEAVATGKWPGVASEVVEVSLPAWMLDEGDVADLGLTGFEGE